MDYTNIIDRFKTELLLKNFSPRTVENYTSNCLELFKHLGKSPFYITEDEIKYFVLHLKNKGIVPKTCNLKLSSIKSFYNLLDTRSKTNVATNIPRQKVPLHIPVVISKVEINTLLNSIENIKHRALLSLMYAGGLRLQETRYLKITDIDSQRMSVFVNGKGDKQRLTLLSKKALILLRLYYKCYRPHHLLFEGKGADKSLSSVAIQKILRRAALKTGIRKKITPHTLRHCFATHLLEDGVAIPAIQKLLGHKNFKTTLIYTHVTDTLMKKIVSPLDSMDSTLPTGKKGGGDE